ncbi:hypothetical protein VN24_14295 [Paenibacillus beijingensis]|uniref:Uncharacterized protein n=2 Tax=Paenibacillus beijingensis TaxID=1126833 RepID=A0A0D5NQZ7_9BACL|nr:hypothetical protein VN24_14295 [Paenibacillus beijingensis]
MLLVVALMLGGCSTASKSPKETLMDATGKTAELKSYAFTGSVKLEELNVPEEMATDLNTSMMLGMLQNAEISWTGAYRLDPMLTEMNMKIITSGDMALTINTTMIMNQDKLWIKVPNIPMLASFIPQSLVGKFVEFDMKELAKEQGTEMPQLDVAKSQQFVNDVSGIVFKHIDEKTYLKSVKPKEAGIPDDAGADKAVQVHVTRDQVEPLAQTVVKNILPEIFDLLSKNEEYRNMLQLTQADLDDARKEVTQTSDEELKKGIEEFNKTVTALDVTSNIGIDKEGYAHYSNTLVKMEMNDNGQTGSGTLRFLSQMTNINGDVKFETGEPKDAVTMEQLQQAINEQMTGGL